MDLYANDNPRYRRALVRERLEAMKAERRALLDERDHLDQAIAAAGEALQVAV